MNTKEYQEIPYSIEIDWEGGTVWLNIHIIQEKIVLTEKDAKSIMNDFELIKAKKNGFI